MPSWRDFLSENAQNQVDELCSLGIQFGRQELEAKGAFYPYATVIDESGQFQTLMVSPEEAEQFPDAQTVLDACRKYVDEQKDELIAMAVTSDVNTPDGDAIAVQIEHRDGVSLMLFLPYEQVLEPVRKVTFGELRAHAAEATVFV